MPLVRVEVRNEYRLGAPELYANANKEDPKAVLEGVAVAGLVGILRQLGDLAEFAAEVFHGLQEQVMITSSRSHKLMGRVQRIEAALPPLEKLVLAQRSHLHFAYTAGANWHSRLRPKQNHFIYSDLPRFIVDSYENCRGPPHLNLLDKFDPGGPGSCLKRYSDPSFFRRATFGSDEAYVDKTFKKKRSSKIKKKRSSVKTVEVSRGASFSNTSGRMQVSSSKMDGQTLPSQTFKSYSEQKSDLGEQSVSLGSRYWSGDLDHISHPSYSMDLEEQEDKESYSSAARMHHKETNSYEFMDEKSSVLDDMRSSLSGEQTGRTSFCVTWDGKSEILEPVSMDYDHDEIMGTISMNFDFGIEESGAITLSSQECDNHKNLETLQMTLDVEAEDKGAGHFRSAENDPDYNLETVSTNFRETLDGEAEDEATRHFRIAEDDCDYKVETLQLSADEDTEDKGASHFRTDENDHDHNFETLSMNFDIETQGRGTSPSRAAKGDDHDQNLENVSSNFDLETQDRGVSHLETAGQMDIHLDSKELSMPISSNIQLGGSETEVVNQLSSQFRTESTQMLFGDVQHDEVESETDNYVDALNTIESEYDTDVDGPTKQEAEQCSDSENKAVDNGVNMLTGWQAGSHSSNSESLNITSSSPDNGPPGLPETSSGQRVTPDAISNSLSMESCHSLQSPQITRNCLDSGSTPDVGSCEIIHSLGSSNVDSLISRVSCGSAKQNLDVPVSDNMTSSCSELQKTSSKHSGVTSVTLWTNGGLLGLEPSKPPDFSMLNVSSEKGKHDNIGPTNPQSDVTEKRCKSVEGTAVPNLSTSCEDDRKGGIFMKKASWLFSSADLGVNLQKLSDSCTPSYADNSQQNGTSETSGTVQPVTPDIQSTRASQDNSSNSSRMFELGNRLLMNGVRRKPSLDKDDNLTSSSSPNAGVIELKDSSRKVDNQMFSERSKDMLRTESPFVSPSSSPPLGHMKISFHPINGFEAQLQLKFSDGIVNQESGRDTFPSFQLVPQPTIPLHDAGSDSEDDTFCRSSAYESDCASYQSDSNSEPWEADASPNVKNHELYDSLGRISFSESVSTSWDTGAVVQGDVNNNYRTQNSLPRNSVEHSQSGHLFDLPSLDALQTSVMERNDHEFISLSEPQCPKERTPSPPPLPPPQWRAMKPQVELEDGGQFVVSENLNYSFDRKFGSTISQHPKPAPLKQEQIIETAQILKSKKSDLQKASRQKEVNQAVFQKEIEQKDDFLHQIRTKSFSLRRTVTAKATAANGPPTSVQVTAILKKANEIRQAVGSDGEDDNWSDT